MGKEYISDLHCHLNGSFSLAFLKTTAEKHKCPELYEQFIQLRKEYLDQTQKQPESGYPKELLDKVWKLFGLIHKIVQDLEDITLGTVSVATSSSAQYIEIRTTPKSVANQPVDAYIDAFEAGLTQIKQDKKINKEVYGLLSLDRTAHGVSDAKHFIQRILNSPNKVLVGLDISGNPIGHRTLSGTDLAQVVTLALNSNVGIAIHMGEADSDIERQDTDAVLNALEQWRNEQPTQEKNLFIGRVRLGHCIYLTQEQKDRIRELGLPIEVCPTCHRLLNWHLENSSHPITEIYDDVGENLVVGTDDDVIFGSPIEMEFNKFLNLFKNKMQMSKKEIEIYQSQFRFSGTILPKLKNVIKSDEPVVRLPCPTINEIRLYAQSTLCFNPLYSQALFNYINFVEEALKKNKNAVVIIEQLNVTNLSVKAALQENNPQALLATANEAYNNNSLPKKIGMTLCGNLCILAGVIGVALAAVAMTASHGFNRPLALWGILLCVNLIIMGGGLVSGNSTLGFFSAIRDKGTVTATEGMSEAITASKSFKHRLQQILDQETGLSPA
ncbi:amidohydrolase family protein [Legionella fallonii]|uniref:Adenosine deaminase n=1 Tax=Legionella fallonii LLAP-10 TaxID=1212491 RepID=A0A098G2U8_9GAMM|nr:hypothetical protein [Legionella fallonii]CEG56311.1 Adenosine deaminase [Legionella fallonii LLAP-10]